MNLYFKITYALSFILFLYSLALGDEGLGLGVFIAVIIMSCIFGIVKVMDESDFY